MKKSELRKIIKEEINFILEGFPKILYHSVTSDKAREYVLKNGIKADSMMMVYLSKKPITRSPFKHTFKVKVPDMNRLYDWRDIWGQGDLNHEYDSKNPYFVYEGDIDKKYIEEI